MWLPIVFFPPLWFKKKNSESSLGSTCKKWLGLPRIQCTGHLLIRVWCLFSTYCTNFYFYSTSFSPFSRKYLPLKHSKCLLNEDLTYVTFTYWIISILNQRHILNWGDHNIQSLFSLSTFSHMVMERVMGREEEVGNRGGKTFCNFPSARCNLRDVHFPLK